MDGTNSQGNLLTGADVQLRLKELMQKTLQEALEGELEETVTVTMATDTVRKGRTTSARI